MASIGETLKNERERRGLSPEEIHDSTRITVGNIGYLEEDRFDAFPNRVYARAFLRDYANYLGLDSASLLMRYEDEWNAAQESTEAVPVSRGSVGKTLGKAILALLLLGALGAGGYYVYNEYGKSEPAKRPAVTAKKAPCKPAESAKPAVTPATSSAATKPGAKPAVKPAPAKPGTPIPAGKIVVEVTATQDVWVGMKIDGKSAFANTLTKGYTKTFEAKQLAELTVGMAGAVQVKLNGVAQPPLGSLKNIGKKSYTIADVNKPAAPAPAPKPESKPAEAR